MTAEPRFPPAILAAHDAACRRGERILFSGLSLEMGSGEALVLRGPNGAGKSSLLRLFAGLLAPEAGRLSWDGDDIRDDIEAHGRRAAYLGHQDAVKAALTVRENLAFWAAFAGDDTGADAVEAAAEGYRLGPLLDLPARILSAGQRRRVALARVLATAAPLWLLDEPATGLDAESVTRLEWTLARHRAAGGMVILSTHAEIQVRGARRLDLGDGAPALSSPLVAVRVTLG